MTQIQAEPDMVRPYYQAAFHRLDAEHQQVLGRPDCVLSSRRRPTSARRGPTPRSASTASRFEALAYWLKWRLPLTLLAFAALIAPPD